MTQLVPAPEQDTISQPPVNDQERLARLETIFLELASHDGAEQEPTTYTLLTEKYMYEGGSLRLCLNEIRDLSDKTDEDLYIEHARERFMGMFLQRSPMRNREWYNTTFGLSEDAYVETVMAKISAHIEAETPEEALDLQQMPSLVIESTFKDGQDTTLEDIAGNHLYVLIDTLLKEHVQRHQVIDRYRHQNTLTRILGNRALRLAIGGLTGVAALTAQLKLLPESDSSIAEHIERTLKFLSATMLSFEAPEFARNAIARRNQKREARELHSELADGYELCDLSLQIAYSKPRYGNKQHNGVVTHRGGTHSKKENLRRFRLLDEQFLHMNNDPGGRPYNGDQALLYAGRLLIQHRDMVDSLTERGVSADERKRRYLDLARTILKEDLTRMKKNQSPHHLREVVLDALYVAPAILYPETVYAASEAKTLGRDASHMHVHHDSSAKEE